MQNFFKDTIPKGENFRRRILIELKMNVTVVDCCFSKLNLWVKFWCPILNDKVNIANVKVVFSAKNVSDKSNQIKHDKERFVGNFIAVLKRENFFPKRFLSVHFSAYLLSLHELPWAVVQLTLPFTGIKSSLISNHPISFEPIQRTWSWRDDHNFFDSRLWLKVGRGRGTRGHAGTRGRDKQTTPNICAEFVEYNFRWSRESYFMLESLLVVADGFQRPWFGRTFLLAYLTVRTLGTE